MGRLRSSFLLLFIRFLRVVIFKYFLAASINLLPGGGGRGAVIPAQYRDVSAEILLTTGVVIVEICNIV